MAASNINRVIMTGNLTSDPELRAAGSTNVCKMRIANNTRRKNSQTGMWEDKPNYFDVAVFGAQAENCKKYLAKGRPIAIDGRLEWREWEAQDGSKRQNVEIIADNVQFLGSPRDENGGGYSNGGFTPRSDVPVDTSDFTPAPQQSQAPVPSAAPVGGGSPAPAGDDDIPF